MCLVPAVLGAEGDQAKDLQDQAALAEKQVDIKRAAVAVVEAEQKIAEAKLRVLKTKVTTAAEMAKGAKVRLEGIKLLVAKNLATEASVDEAEAAFRAATSAAREAEDNVQVGEAEVLREKARLEIVFAEFEEAKLRLKLLRDRLK
jgi:multidrug resistance efflux pump